MDYCLLGSSVHGISQARILEWVAISFSMGSSWPRDETCVFCIDGGFFSAEPLGTPNYSTYNSWLSNLGGGSKSFLKVYMITIFRLFKNESSSISWRCLSYKWKEPFDRLYCMNLILFELEGSTIKGRERFRVSGREALSCGQGFSIFQSQWSPSWSYYPILSCFRKGKNGARRALLFLFWSPPRLQIPES